VTNNETEHRTLIAGLKDLAGRIHRAGKASSGCSLPVDTDSRIKFNQWTQGWQVTADSLRPMAGRLIYALDSRI